MELSSFAARQKRARDWEAFAREQCQDPAIQTEIIAAVREYRLALTQCWEEQRVSPEAAAKIADLERRLTQLNEEARLRVVGRATL